LKPFDHDGLLTLLTRLPRSTYYDKHYRQSAALIRARQPYLIKNIFTGLGLCVFVIGVCGPRPLLQLLIGHLLTRILYTDSWTINAVAQDDFSDVPIPDAPSQPPHSPHTGVEKPVSEALLNKQKEERLERVR